MAAADSTSPFTAPFAVAMASWLVSPMVAATVDARTMLPPVFIIAFAAARTV